MREIPPRPHCHRPIKSDIAPPGDTWERPAVAASTTSLKLDNETKDRVRRLA